MTDSPAPAIPAGYALAHRFVLTERRALLWMNVIGTVAFVIVLAAAFVLLTLYIRIGAPLVIRTLPETLPPLIYLIAVVLTLVVHEGLHGLAILLTGNRPRFGAKWSRFLLYTTSDANFTRGEYLGVTLAPLLGISAAGLVAMLLTPPVLGMWLAVLVSLNAASSLGDVWMTAVITSFPRTALFHDEEDGM
ncbi:MAG: DUF3267 domain-containing protein, partial [Anaerolineae bacterium]|nr:DUF3267 domain-containing protein [Anaerolineae bacterium]